MTYPVALLTFSDPRGLDKESFNTIRLGRGWVARIDKGDRVLLAHKHRVLGSARVSAVIAGKVSELLPIHARFNHIELAMVQPGYQHLLAPHRRLESMRKNYGPARVGDDPFITIIYLKT